MNNQILSKLMLRINKMMSVKIGRFEYGIKYVFLTLGYILPIGISMFFSDTYGESFFGGLPFTAFLALIGFLWIITLVIYSLILTVRRLKDIFDFQRNRYGISLTIVVMIITFIMPILGLLLSLLIACLDSSFDKTEFYKKYLNQSFEKFYTLIDTLFNRNVVNK